MTAKTRRFFNIVFAFLFATGLTACGDSVVGPTPTNYLVVFDTTTLRIPADVGSGWSVWFSTVVVGENELASGRLEYKNHTPELARVVAGYYNPIYGWSDVGLPKVTYEEALGLQFLAAGTVKVTVWHPADPRKKKVLIADVK